MKLCACYFGHLVHVNDDSLNTDCRLLRFMFRMSGCTVDTGKALTTHIGVEISSMSTSSSFSQARAMVSLEEDPFHGQELILTCTFTNPAQPFYSSTSLWTAMFHFGSLYTIYPCTHAPSYTCMHAHVYNSLSLQLTL